MGRLLLVYRLGLRDLRYRPAPAILLLLAIAAGVATLTLGIALRGTLDDPYARTRVATDGPDVVATVQTGGAQPTGSAAVGRPGAGNADQPDASALDSLEGAPGVIAHSGPFPVAWTVLRAGRTPGSAEVEGRDTAPDPVDRPALLRGGWVRPGGVVVEAGFAAHLGVHVGQRLTLGRTDLEVVGTAVTAAIPSYPNTCAAEGCILGNEVAAHNPGLVWATPADTLRIAEPNGPDAYYLNLKLDDPATAVAFAGRHNADATSPTAPYLLSWQQLRDGDAQTLAKVRQVLLAGSWLLALLALAGVTVLVGGRMAEQTRRVGLIKAVGGTPWLVAAVLLFEHLLVGLGAAVAGLAAGRLAAPLIDRPGAGLLGAAGAPAVTAGTIAAAIALALAVAGLATFGPAIRAARQSTVAGLNDAARTPRRQAAAVRLTAHLPVPLLLGIRIAVRRPRRLVLNALSIAVTTSGIVTVLTYRATSGAWLADPGMTQATTLISAMLVVLAAANAAFVSWSTALDARHTAALARALGATPGQVTGGLTAAQLIPALLGALLGIPGGIALYQVPQTGGRTTLPGLLSLLAVVAAVLVGTAVLSLLPARLGLRRPVAEALDTA